MKKVMTRKLHLVPFLLLMFFACAGLHCTKELPDLIPVDACPEYDVDCDDISNAVEQNGANSYLGLDYQTWNANPSIARGLYNDGSIENALNLPDQGSGYWHNRGTDPVDSDDWGVLHMLNMIEGAGRAWSTDERTPPRITVNDISKGDVTTLEFGGYWSDHPGGSHQNGLDVDIRYIRRDTLESPLNVRTDQDKHDQYATSDLLNLLAKKGNVVRVYISNYALIDPLDSTVVIDTTGVHDDHIHVRIADPDGSNN